MPSLFPFNQDSIKQVESLLVLLFNPWKWFGQRRREQQTTTTHIQLQHIRLLLTKTGVFFLGVLFITLIGAINYAVNLAYFLVFLLMALFILSLFYCLSNLQGLHFRSAACTPVYAGDPALFPIHISGNHNKHYYSIMLSLPDHEPHYVDVDPNDDHLINLQITSAKRGWLALPPVQAGTRYPLSLFRASVQLKLQQKILVYPKPISPGWWPTFDGDDEQTGKIKITETGDFYGLKNYTESDSPKRIAWKIFAQGRGLYSKQFNEPTGEAIIFKWQYVSDYPLEQALSYLCFWILDAHHNQLEYGLELPHKVIALNKGEKHLQHCLQSLALFQP